MSTTVCVDGDEFAVNPDGSLSLLLCGNRPKTAWPYDADPASYNPLRVSEDCGLWVPPSADVAVGTSATESGGLVQPSSAGITLLTLIQNVTNPSGALTAQAVAHIQVSVTYSRVTQSVVDNYIKAMLEWDEGDGAGYGSSRALFRDSMPYSSTTAPTMTFGTKVNLTTTTRLIHSMDPGETRVCKVRIKAESEDSSGDQWGIAASDVDFRWMVVATP